jgi:prevent-host-death family protein
MRTINIHEAKTQLSKLVEEAAKGEPFVIAKAGKPMVKVMALDAPEPRKIQRFGFMKGVGTTIPEDFDRMFDAQIEELFGLNDDSKAETIE